MFPRTASRRLPLVTAVCAAAGLSAIALWPAPSSVAEAMPAQPGMDNPVFARLVSGVYVWALEGGNSAIMQIGADGTAEWFGSWFYDEFKAGPVYAAWEQTGPLEIRTVELDHLMNEDGSYFAIACLNQTITFDPDLRSFTFDAVEKLYLPGQDPSDPNEEPFVSFPFSGGPYNKMNP